MLGGRPREELLAQYSADHQNPMNKRFHLFGIPTVVLAIALWITTPFIPSLWIWAVTFTIVGVALQLIGHQFEGKPPSAQSDWSFLLIGLEWWVRHMRGKT